LQVIKGWDEGVANMKVGERAELTCSPGKKSFNLTLSLSLSLNAVAINVFLVCPYADYAYGDRAVGGDLIPANSTLIFDVELLGIE
jgi:peptidylprolyl isomerase